MANKDLLLHPHKVGQSTEFWWYECDNGIEIYSSFGNYTDDTRPPKLKISWVALRNALKRKDKP